MANLVTQSLKILSKATMSVGKEYTSNLTAFVNDAKDVKNTIMNAGTDAADTYVKLKRTNITKAIHDWFYQEEAESESTLNAGNDEFDAGFSSDGSSKSDDDYSPKATVLTSDAMTNIANKQTNAIIKVGRRQTEQSVANTAEIVSSLNSRSAEMLTAVNNINKTLLGISSRLDKIIELQAVPLTNQQQEIDKGGLYQDGKLSLMRIFEQSKNTMMSSGPMSFLQVGIDALRSGTLGPSALAAMGVKGLAQKIQVNGKSFDDWGKAFNEMIGTATQTAMNEMINSKVFKKMFPGLTSFEGDKDYGTVVPNYYDNKRAQFDGMTRMSIVNVIPEMLAKINQSISGQEYHLDSRGKWIAGPMKNDFNEVTRASFQSGGLNANMSSRISNAGVQSIGKKIPSEDIKDASEALTMAMVMKLHKDGDRSFTASRIKTELVGQIENAVAVLSLMGRGDADYWYKVCQTIVVQLSSGMLDSASFVTNINQSLQKMISDATNFAQSGKANASQATKLTFNMAANQFLATHGAPNPTGNNNINANGTLASADGAILNPGQTLGKYSTGQYVSGIFYLLNRGINVRIDKDAERYDPITLAQVRPDAKPYVSDDTFGKMVAKGLSGKASKLDNVAEAAVKNQMGVDNTPSGFINKMLNSPAAALSGLSKLLNFNLGDTTNKLKEKAKGFLGEERYNAAADKLGGFKDRVIGDERFQNIKATAQEKLDALKDKASEAGNKIGHTRVVNNMAYAADSLKLRSAEDTLDHFKSDDEFDKTRVAGIRGLLSEGRFDLAEQYLERIKNPTLRKALADVTEINKKRKEGADAAANGEQADIGAVLITRTEDDDGKVGKDESQRSILGRMLGMVGRIAKGVAKLAARGAIDLTMGLKSMAQGLLLGYKDVDAEGNVHKNKGLIRNLTTVPMGAMAKGAKKAVGAVATGVKNALTNDEGESIVSKGFKTVRGLLNKLLDGIGAFKDMVKDRIGGALDKLKESRFGQAVGKVTSALGNNKFMRGFTSGFKDAKAARDKLLNAKKREEDASENPLRAEQTEMMEGKKPSIFTKIHELLLGISGSVTRQEEIAEDEAKKQDKEPTGNPDAGDILNTNNSRNDDDNDGGSRGGGILGGIKGVIGDIMGDFGKMMGGMTQALLGIGEMVISIVTSLESFGALKDMVQSILVDGLQPLNEAFDAIMEAIKPLVDTLKGMVTMIAKVVVNIAKSLIDVVQPIIEAIMPIIQTVIDLLSPILKIIEVLMNVIMIPIKIAMDIISPVIEGIGYTLQVVSGVLQIGLGAVMGLLGAIVAGIGLVLSFMPGSVGDKGDELKATGEGMLEMSKTMLKAGAEQIKQGIQGGISLIQRLIPGGEDGKNDKEEDDTKYEDKRKAQLANEFASGNVSPTTINNSWSYTYGSGNTNTTMNQHSYGGYMNMSERGCGPVALADAYGRRSGMNVNPARLAASMGGAGTYDPRRGTSVASMLDTGNAMGMGMRVGGVTAASISRSSPTNPITVLGSGQGFGTRNGNNHYVNVVGTDGHGGAYVSNPMTGRVDKQAMSNIVLNSKLGLYGSGDENEYADYGFSDEATESLQRLKDLTSKLTTMFTGESDAEKKIKDANAEQKAKEIKRTLGDDYDAVEQQAIAELKSKYPNLSDAQIQKKLNSREGWNLIQKYGGQSAADTYSSGLNLIKEGGTEVINNMDSIKSKISAISTKLQDERASSSVTGAEMTPFSPIIFRKPYLDKETITDDEGNEIPAALIGHDSNGGRLVKYFGSPVHNFFNSDLMKTINNGGEDTAYTSRGWYGKFYGPQTAEGVGSSGPEHEGVVLGFGRTRYVPAITGGTVTYVTKNARTGKSNGLGNSVKWRDSGGMYHWYMHLGSISKDILEGSNIEPGMVIGTTGNTGEGAEGFDSPILRYVVTSAGPMGNTGDAGHINPFTYWQFEESNNHGSYEKNDYMNGSFWGQTYADKFSKSDYHNQAQKAGLTGAQEAMIGAIGIHEDSAQKLVGEKSLTTVTQDGNGQTAFGIMNWIPDPQNQYVGATETKYGTTLAEQLPYMRQMYFDSNPTHDRARIVSDNYSKYSANLQQVLGHSLALKPGDAWGPLAESDIAEAMGHYVANALVPADWYTTEGLGKRIGTAVDIYNWMIDKGWIQANKQGFKEGGNSVNGHFVASKTNPNAFISQDGYFSSDGGAVLADYGKPSITSTNIEGTTSGNSPLHEFFSKTGGQGSAYSANENWYSHRLNPNKQGVGSQDSALGEHGGVDINWDTGSADKELHATTAGTVDGITTGGSAGNSVKWLDKAGYLHWYMHMRDKPLVNDGDTIKPGQLLGYVGNTGDSGGAHLHYSIIEGSKFNGWSNSPGGVNPLMYFRNYNSAGPQTNPNERGGLSFVTGQASTNDGSVAAGMVREMQAAKTAKLYSDIQNSGGMANYVKQLTGNGFNMWDANSYKTAGGERFDALRQLVEYHNMATDQSSNNPNYNDYYHITYGGKRDYDYMKNWMIDYINDPKKNGDFQEFLTDLHALNPESFVKYPTTSSTGSHGGGSNTRGGSTGGSISSSGHYRGGGDVPSSWYDALFNTNPSIVATNDIPPVDESKLNDDAGLNALKQYTNKYNIKADDSRTTDMLNKLGSMTFNVRAKRVEELLEILINKVDSTPTDQPLPNMFDEEIPDAVTRLSIG